MHFLKDEVEDPVQEVVGQADQVAPHQVRLGEEDLVDLVDQVQLVEVDLADLVVPVQLEEVDLIDQVDQAQLEEVDLIDPVDLQVQVDHLVIQVSMV